MAPDFGLAYYAVTVTKKTPLETAVVPNDSLSIAQDDCPQFLLSP